MGGGNDDHEPGPRVQGEALHLGDDPLGTTLVSGLSDQISRPRGDPGGPSVMVDHNTPSRLTAVLWGRCFIPLPSFGRPARGSIHSVQSANPRERTTVASAPTHAAGSTGACKALPWIRVARARDKLPAGPRIIKSASRTIPMTTSNEMNKTFLFRKSSSLASVTERPDVTAQGYRCRAIAYTVHPVRSNILTTIQTLRLSPYLQIPRLARLLMKPFA